MANISVADMKRGDLVKLITQYDWPNGIIVEQIYYTPILYNIPDEPWFWVLQSNGQRVMWPKSQMVFIDGDR